MKKALIIILSLLATVIFMNACSKECEHSWSDATCASPQTCSKCSATQGTVNDAAHDYQGGSCTQGAICTVCNKQEAAPGHVWQSASCLSYQSCQNCDAKGAYKDHTWLEADCTHPKRCSDCHTTEGEAGGHIYEAGSCDTTRKCTVCKTAQLSATEHTWQEATCKAPKTCSACGKTEGKKLDHVWTLTQTISASCSDGKKIYTCICGDTRETTVAAVKSYHNCDENGYCKVCKTQFSLSSMTLDSIVVNDATVVRAGVFTSTETKTKIYKPILSTDINMPIVELNGDISSINRNNSVTIPFSYECEEFSFDCMVQIKLQGASSLNHPKKNYSIKLFNEDGSRKKVELSDGWGKESKYCMKANYVDYSQARNVVSAKIFGDIIRSRDVEDELSELANGGAIDGYPILLYLNGEFLGMYTMNIPKDNWMFGMSHSDEKNQAILMGIDWQKSVAFRAQMQSGKISNGWELEFASNEDSEIDKSVSWVADSMNALIKFVMENDGEDFINGIHEYADVDKCIDSMLYTFAICADDNISKNILWVTYDGKVWFSSVYDMDGTWGMQWNGNFPYTENTHLISNLADGKADAGRSHDNYNLLWEKIYIYFYDRVVERYLELRAGPLSMENITKRFEDFFALIPEVAYEAEKVKWQNVPSQGSNNINQILDFAPRRLARMDEILVKK